MEDHPKIWMDRQHWFEHLDQWVTHHVPAEFRPFTSKLGGWKRAPHTHFDIHSAAYQDMVFFHPFVRRAFFDTGDDNCDHEALIHNYSICPEPGSRLFYEAEDILGNSAKVEINDLRLMMFANGVSILVVSVEADGISYDHALWINEMMRKIYPSSDRQIQTGRIPNRLRLILEEAEEKRLLVEERWENSKMIGFRPHLSRILLSLLYFANYRQEEFEPILDERMIVNTFVSRNRAQLPAGYEMSDEYDASFSRLLYVDRSGSGYRYETNFIREQMSKQVYRRWQHLGTLYGITGYSSVTSILADTENSHSTSLVYRMFRTKNQLIALIALFYRTSLLDFAKESALVSRQLFPIFTGQTVRHRHIQFATRLMADFHYFNNYWFFSELTTKDEELEHFQMHCVAYQIGPMKEGLGDQIDRLAGYIDRLYALRNNDAVNRLAMLSVILGIGALVTGYYGMNIPHLETMVHRDAVSFWSLVLTSVMTVTSLSFIVYIVGSNWVDYRASLMPHRYRKPATPNSFRRLNQFSGDDESMDAAPAEGPA